MNNLSKQVYTRVHDYKRQKMTLHSQSYERLSCPTEFGTLVIWSHSRERISYTLTESGRWTGAGEHLFNRMQKWDQNFSQKETPTPYFCWQISNSTASECEFYHYIFYDPSGSNAMEGSCGLHKRQNHRSCASHLDGKVGNPTHRLTSPIVDGIWCACAPQAKFLL